MLRGLSGYGVNSTLDEIAPVELLVQPDEHEAQDRSRDHGEKDGAAVDGHGDDVARRHPVLVHVRSVDTRGVRDGVDEGEGGGALGGRPGKRVADPGESYDERTVDARDLFGVSGMDELKVGAQDQLTISIIATYRGARLVVAAARIKAAIATTNDSIMCQYLSPVRSACHAFMKVQMTVST